MLCECQQRQATIHEVIIQHGKKVERHLCEQCASKLGVSTDPHMPISQLITNYISGKNLSIPTVGDGDKLSKTKPVQSPATPRPGKTPPCPSCDTSFAKFKESGLLGCPSCYATFQSRLTPLIARAHDGGEQHIGKVPRRALAALTDDPGSSLESLIGGASEREQRLTQVRAKLANAVEHEDYEQAAMLRDEMTRLASFPSVNIKSGVASEIKSQTQAQSQSNPLKQAEQSS
ncbi:MAG: UvrB/UvrC motif-containing protein [Phycisphaerales bacterium]